MDCNNGNGVRLGSVVADEDVIEVVVVELNEVDEVDTAAVAEGAHVVAATGCSGGDSEDIDVDCFFITNDDAPSRPLNAVGSAEVLSAAGALSLRVEMVL